MKTCKLIVKDEVNVKFEGLELNDRKTLMKMFEYDIPGARYLPAVKLGRWNGKVSYFSLAGSTYINLLPEILPLLDQAGYDIELCDIRDYTTTFEFNTVTEDLFSQHLWPEKHPLSNQPILLRDYQIEVINRFLQNPQCIQEVATGAGKCLAGDTLIKITIDEKTPFGKFMLNKLQQEQVNVVTKYNRNIQKEKLVADVYTPPN